jgi:uncharacterized protein YecE (DUF72 family)
MTRSDLPSIRIGIGGWTFEPWRGVFYPAGLAQKGELAYAASKLTSIEINGTYYGSQKPDSFKKWHDETPDGFVFSLKASRFCTHRRVLAEAGPSIEKFIMGGLLALKDKLGPINWQFMATKKFDPEDFGAFLALLPRSVEGRRLRHAVEVRHESFRGPVFYALARHHGVAIIHAGDSPHPAIDEATAPFAYARIMGTREDEPSGYSEPDLDRWAGQAKSWASDGREVFLYVIGGAKQHNPAAAMALIGKVELLIGEFDRKQRSATIFSGT